MGCWRFVDAVGYGQRTVGGWRGGSVILEGGCRRGVGCASGVVVVVVDLISHVAGFLMLFVLNVFV